GFCIDCIRLSDTNGDLDAAFPRDAYIVPLPLLTWPGRPVDRATQQAFIDVEFESGPCVKTRSGTPCPISYVQRVAAPADFFGRVVIVGEKIQGIETGHVEKPAAG